jgi:haloalkane dehalogenase
MQVIPLLAPKVSPFEAGISPEFPFAPNFARVRGSKMHYVDVGSGDPIVLLHGNPTSSYLWRNIIPELSTRGRVIAVDMIGMGLSDKPDIPYRFTDHAAYFSDLMKVLGLRKATLVLHDWGGAVGLHFAANNPSKVKAIVMMEALIRPMQSDDANFVERYMFNQFRGDESGRKLLIEQNYFVERALNMMAGRTLSDAEMTAYRAPYLNEEDRQPVWQWPREIPIDGTPADNAAILQRNYDWLKASNVPLLLLHATPGAIIKAPMVADLKRDIPRLETTAIGRGLHYVQETTPNRIAAEVSNWIATL